VKTCMCENQESRQNGHTKILGGSNMGLNPLSGLVSKGISHKKGLNARPRARKGVWLVFL